MSPRRSSTIDSERAYRRGAHQTCARLRDIITRRCTTLDDARALLARAEGVLASYREGVIDPGSTLLDDLEERLLRGPAA
jgi:hypothetical protein